MSRDQAAAPSTPAVRMHAITDETTEIVDMVLEYARRRILSDDTPLDKPFTPAELRRLAGQTISEGGMGARRALALFENYLQRRKAQPHFANARSVRTALDRLRLRQASRLFADRERQLTADDLSTIAASDILASRLFQA